jgi:hypothetical protein
MTPQALFFVVAAVITTGTLGVICSLRNMPLSKPHAASNAWFVMFAIFLAAGVVGASMGELAAMTAIYIGLGLWFYWRFSRQAERGEFPGPAGRTRSGLVISAAFTAIFAALFVYVSAFSAEEDHMTTSEEIAAREGLIAAVFFGIWFYHYQRRTPDRR